MGTPTQRFQVSDLGSWGRLVKSWATHLDYVSQGYADEPSRSCHGDAGSGDAGAGRIGHSPAKTRGRLGEQRNGY